MHERRVVETTSPEAVTEVVSEVVRGRTVSHQGRKKDGGKRGNGNGRETT